MSSIAKSGISISKKDLIKSRIPLVASRNVTFYHKSPGGQLSLDLLALSMPSEMPTNTQATVAEISGAQLAINKKNLTLISSANGPLMQGLHYVVTSSTTIQLIGPYAVSGTEPDEIFTGIINSAPIGDLVVASAKSVIKTYELPVGQNTLNLGLEYQTGQNINDDIGSIRVYINGVLAHRGVDYNEVDAGSGYGTTIFIIAAPVSFPYQVAVDFGVMSITDNNAIGTLESLSGSVLKIAKDLADVAGTDVGDYVTASPSEIERRVFGDSVLALQKDLAAAIALIKAKAVLNWGFSAGLTTTAGTTNTKIVNLTGGNQIGSWADYFTITPSATLGTTFVARKRLLLTTFVSGNASGSDTYNISVNSSQLSTPYTDINDNSKVTANVGFGPAGGGAGARIIEVGDILRVHLDQTVLTADGYFKLIFKVDEAI